MGMYYVLRPWLACDQLNRAAAPQGQPDAARASRRALPEFVGTSWSRLGEADCRCYQKPGHGQGGAVNLGRQGPSQSIGTTLKCLFQ